MCTPCHLYGGKQTWHIPASHDSIFLCLQTRQINEKKQQPSSHMIPHTLRRKIHLKMYLLLTFQRNEKGVVVAFVVVNFPIEFPFQAPVCSVYFLNYLYNKYKDTREK